MTDIPDIPNDLSGLGDTGINILVNISMNGPDVGTNTELLECLEHLAVSLSEELPQFQRMVIGTNVGRYDLSGAGIVRNAQANRIALTVEGLVTTDKVDPDADDILDAIDRYVGAILYGLELVDADEWDLMEPDIAVTVPALGVRNEMEPQWQR